MRLIEPVVVTDTGSFSRASTGTYHDKDGLLQTAAVDEPRWNYNPADLTQPPVLLVENARTNVAKWSEDVTNAVWFKGSMTAGSSPVTLAGLPAKRLTLWGGNVLHYMTENITVGNPAWLHAAVDVSGLASKTVVLHPDGVGSKRVFFIWTGPRAITVTGLGGVIGSYVILGDYQAILYAYLAAAAGTFVMFYVGNYGVYDGDGQYIDITRIQSEFCAAGESYSSYIPTTTAAVTRAADVLGGMLVTNVPENDYTEYSDITTYAIGDRCMVTSAAQHNVYTSVTAGNLDHDPALEPDPVNAPVNWQFVGKTNRWKPFDGYISSQASLADRLLYSIKIPDGVMTDSVALMNIDAEFAGVTVTDDAEGQIYQNEFNLISESGITDYWEYFFAPIRRQANLTLTGLDVYAGVRIDVELKDDGGAPKCGALVSGISYDIGDTRYGLSMSSTDYSVKTVDAFGNITLTQRPYSNDMELSAWVPNADMAEVNAKLISRRATPTIFIGAPDIYDEATAVYGWVESWGNVVEYQSYSILSINIKGLT